MTSAEIPCGTISQRSVSLSERSPPFEPIGTRDIISTPAEITTSSCPDQTAAAALKFVCIEEPHWRSTVVPQTVSGQPATSGAIRPMFQPCSPICVTQPICTSSTSAGSRWFRSTSPFSTCAASSSPRIFDSIPSRFPIGLRTASTMSASGIDNRVKPPGPHALELVLAVVIEANARPGDEVLDGARDEDIPGPSQSGDPGTCVHRDSRDLAVDELDLA